MRKVLQKASNWFSLASAAWRSGRRRFEFGLLPQVLLAFHVEILSLFHFMQLAWIALDGRDPLTQTLFESLLRRCGHGAEKGLDGEVIAHGVAFHQAAYSTDAGGLAVGSCDADGKSHLAPPDCGEVDLQCKPSHQAIGLGVRKVDECAPAFHRDGLEHDAVV